MSLDEWREAVENYSEAQALAEEQPDDAEVAAIVKDLRQSVADLVAVLNRTDAARGIQPTDGVRFEKDGDATRCVFDRPAPYQVLFDGQRWYSCVVLAVVPPAQDTQRLQFRCWVLGYNVEEVAYGEHVRPWEIVAPLHPDEPCLAVTSGAFAEATVDKVTPKNTVFVKFADNVQEVPLSHVLGGKFFKELRRRARLSDSERAAAKTARRAEKRQRQEERQQSRAEVIVQKAEDYQSFMEDLGF